MILYFNGESITTQASNLEVLIAEKNLLNTTGIAVALNNKVIDRKGWKDVSLKEGDKVLVITATQGG